MKKDIKEEIKEDIGKYAGIEGLANTDGGKELIANLEDSFMSVIDKLTSKPNNEEIYSLIAELDITLKMLRVFNRAGKNKELALEALRNEEKREQEQS